MRFIAMLFVFISAILCGGFVCGEDPAPQQPTSLTINGWTFGGDDIAPKYAANTDEIIAYVGKHKERTGDLQYALMKQRSREVFSLWYSPSISVPGSLVHVFSYIHQGRQWKLFSDEKITRTAELSVTVIPAFDQLVYFDQYGKKVFTYNIGKLDDHQE